jgi:transposase
MALLIWHERKKSVKVFTDRRTYGSNDNVRDSQIREFQDFVVSIERDKAAVVAGLTLPQNSGLVEGKVNKLKLIKRMMYGRAEFPLLRQRVLHAL